VTARREAVLAWTGTIVAALYFAWRGTTVFRATRTFRAMFEGLGAELPAATRLVVAYRVWILAIVFVLPALFVLGKEFVVRDKRTSMMITMLVVIVFLFVVDLLVTAYYLPLFSLIDKLS
jgi:type II secretory pathway component PulF